MSKFRELHPRPDDKDKRGLFEWYENMKVWLRALKWVNDMAENEHDNCADSEWYCGFIEREAEAVIEEFNNE